MIFPSSIVPPNMLTPTLFCQSATFLIPPIFGCNSSHSREQTNKWELKCSLKQTRGVDASWEGWVASRWSSSVIVYPVPSNCVSVKRLRDNVGRFPLKEANSIVNKA